MSAPSSSGAPAASARARVPLFTADAWAPLKVDLFRSLWIATSIAQIGTWAHAAAGPWLMHLLTQGWHTQPAMVAAVVLGFNLAICLFSVPAGALADVMDRRQLLIVTQIWMIVVAALLGLLILAGVIGPWRLLMMTFLLGMGVAASGPALQAVLPELVPLKQFALAINMNSVALNVARAVGPAMFILVVLFLPGRSGVGVSYLLTGASFIASAWVLWRWNRAPQRAALHGEEVWDAVAAGFRYTVFSPANRAILLRVVTFIVPALVMWAQVPIIATGQLHMGVYGYAILYAFMGVGAVLGVFLMPGLHGRYKIDPVVNVCTALFALGLIALSFTHQRWLAVALMFFLGVNWVIVPTNFNTATQKSVPPWVKGRAISFYLTFLFGSFSAGALLWGLVTTRWGIHVSLLAGGIMMLALLTLAKWFPLTLNEGKDLGPAYASPPVDLIGPQPTGEGAIQVGRKYRVPTHRQAGFNDLLHDLRSIRLRNGAHAWRWEQVEQIDGHLVLAEVIIFSSWQSYTRSFGRATRWDLMVEGLAREYQMEATPATLAVHRPRRIIPPIPFLSGPSRPVAGTAAKPPTQAGMWFADRVADAVDRIIDEVFVAYDRVAVPRKRKTAWRTVHLQIPASAPDDSRTPGS